MKTWLKGVVSVLLAVMLIGFAVWRNDALPDLSSLTDFMQQASDDLNSLKDLISTPPRQPVAPSDDQEAFYPDFSLSQGIDSSLEEALCQGLEAQQTEIDISAYNVPIDELSTLVAQITLSHPELFYVSGSFSYTYSGNTVICLKPTYTYGGHALVQARQAYQGYIDAIVAGVPAGATDFDKLLYLHDYFIQNYSYDYSYTIRDAYAFFEQKTGVCQAYMLALIAASEALGIESIPVISQEMRHAWNLVLLDGEWYHVDLTWDDSLPISTMANYTYFLRSDAGMAIADQDAGGERHYNWTATQTADDIRYDTAAWHKAQSPILKTAGSYYCTVPESDSGEKEVYGAIWGGSDVCAMTRMHSIRALWRAGGSARHIACFSTLIAYDGGILYNTNNTLRLYDPATGADTIVCLLNIANGNSVYGLCSLSSDGVLSYLEGNYELSYPPAVKTQKLAS